MYGYGYRYNSGLVVGAGGGVPFLNTYSLDFDGVDDYVATSGVYSELDGQTKMTFSAWIKPTTAATTVIASIEDNGSTEQFRVVFHSSRYILIRTYTASGRDTRTANGSIDLNVWTHIAFCLDFALSSGTRGKIFINGVDATSIDAMNQASLNTSGGALRIGARNVGTLLPFPGLIDEVAIWSATDQRANISDIYSVEGAVDLSLLATPPTNWYRNGDNGSYKSPQWLLPNNENKDKVSNYSFEFDGVDDRIDTAAIDLGLENTISFWAKRNGTNFFGMVWGGTVQSNYYTVYFPNDNKLLYRVGTGANTFNDANIVSAIGGNDWFHCALVRNNSGADLLCYINGALEQTITGIVGSTNNTIVQNIGSRATLLDFEITGFLDEMSLFNSALSASDILNIYNGGTPTTLPSGAVAHYKMGEEATFSGGVWTVPDSVGSNNGTSNAMTIEDRVGEAPSSENNALSFNMDLVDRVTDVPT